MKLNIIDFKDYILKNIKDENLYFKRDNDSNCTFLVFIKIEPEIYYILFDRHSIKRHHLFGSIMNGDKLNIKEKLLEFKEKGLEHCLSLYYDDNPIVIGTRAYGYLLSYINDYSNVMDGIYKKSSESEFLKEMELAQEKNLIESIIL